MTWCLFYLLNVHDYKIPIVVYRNNYLGNNELLIITNVWINYLIHKKKGVCDLWHCKALKILHVSYTSLQHCWTDVRLVKRYSWALAGRGYREWVRADIWTMAKCIWPLATSVLLLHDYYSHELEVILTLGFHQAPGKHQCLLSSFPEAVFMLLGRCYKCGH